jgi:hypothetical protein
MTDVVDGNAAGFRADRQTGGLCGQGEGPISCKLWIATRMTASLGAMSQAWMAAARNLGARTHLVSRAGSRVQHCAAMTDDGALKVCYHC